MTPEELQRVLRTENDYQRNLNDPSGMLVSLVVGIIILLVVLYTSGSR